MLLNPLTEPALKRKYYLMNQKVYNLKFYIWMKNENISIMACSDPSFILKVSNFVNQVDKEQTALKSLKQLKHR
jgi:hypothetical protein